jgi:hypothetical protein
MSAIRFLLIVAAIPPTLFVGGVQDSVAVDTARIIAVRPLIPRGAPNVVRIIDQEFFTNLPARGIDAAVVLQPGVITQEANALGEPFVAVRGGREGEIEYRLEGAPANDLIWGGRALAVTAEAVEQIQFHAGGPAAEFGGAGAGVAGIQLRTGRTDRWSGSLIAETDRYTGMNKSALEGYSYGYADWTGTAGGPIPGLGNVLRLFGSVQNTFYRDPTVSVRSGYNFSGANAIVTDFVQTPGHSAPAHDTLNIVSPDGNATGGGENRWIMTGTALLDLSPLQVRVAGSYSYDRSQTPADLLNILNQSRLPLNIGNNGFFNARVTDAVSPAFSVEASFSYSGKSFVTEDPQLLDNLFAYGDPAANAALGYRLRGSSLNWPTYQLWGGGVWCKSAGDPNRGI